jgi:regulator of protease activity HflC (stomatin/prohibitin superfamily)
MERNIQRNGLVNLLVLLAVGVAGFAVARTSDSLAGQVGLVFVGVGILVSAVSWFQMRLEEREGLEKLELDELSKSRGDTALFKQKNAEIFPAQRSRVQFERFFVPIFTALLCLAQGLGAWFFWRWLSQLAKTPAAIELKEPTLPLFVFGLFALVLFMLGRFAATIARLGNHRLLRPGAAYLLLNAYLSAIVALGMAVVVFSEFKLADFYVARFLCLLLALVAIETLVQLVLEIYRPRTKAGPSRPLYESRLVGLLGQPEGLITTAAQALDYQFGFKVSETWFYRFLRRAVGVLVLLQLGVFILSTCVVFIEAGEQGLLERFGRPVAGRTLLQPGGHLKLPWPIDKVYRFRTEQIQSFTVGLAPSAANEQETVVLWTVAHTKEDNFLVANRESAAPEAQAGTTNTVSGKRTPPVSLITGTIPIQFQITNLMCWAYTNEDSPALLEDLATREVVRYLVEADMNEILSHGRREAADALLTRIQTAADKLTLGAKILSVGLNDLHPPVKVAPDYEKVVSAIHTKHAKILGARADSARTNGYASAQARSTVNKATSDSVGRQAAALAQAAAFTNQIPAYHAAPAVYAERAYEQTFARATATARKYILLTTNTHEVIQFDLQDKVRADMLMDINPGTKPK